MSSFNKFLNSAKIANNENDELDLPDLPQEVPEILVSNAHVVPVEEVPAVPAKPNVLVKHGPAPYQNSKENSLSYYAVVGTPEGKDRTIWGVDLERSIGAADVAIGDTVRFTNQGKQWVTIHEKNADGKLEDKKVERVTWLTQKMYPPIPAAEVAGPSPNTITQGSLPPALQRKEEAEEILQTKLGRIRGGCQRPDPLQRIGPAPTNVAGAPVFAYLSQFNSQEIGAYVSYKKGDRSFVDHGPQIGCSNSDELTINAMIDCAAQKGWQSLHAEGGNEFCRSMWLQGLARGFIVSGYTPTPADLDTLNRLRPELNTPNKLSQGEPAPVVANLDDKPKAQVLDMKKHRKPDSLDMDI